ncbi:MAG: hypothetical protein ACI8TQ_000550 [Planctomycetota bacterium]|jgi:hypothetical protein
MSKVTPDEVIVEGWDWIATTERNRGDKLKARKAMRKACPHVGNDGEGMLWGLRTALYHWENRDELKSSDKSFALKVAMRCQELNLEILSNEGEQRDLEVLDVLARC